MMPVTVINVASSNNTTTSTTGRTRRADDEDFENELINSTPRSPRHRSTFIDYIRRSGVVLWVLAASSGITWIVKGLCICVGMMLVGSVGSFTLHQMMSPQIESLLKQRNELQRELETLQHQVNSMTRIADSRLEMIHLLEKELEKQTLAAAAAVNPLNNGTIFDHPSKDNTINDNTGNGPGNNLEPVFFWPTIIYVWVVGTMLLMIVLYRLYSIAQAEMKRTSKKGRVLNHSQDRRYRRSSSDGSNSMLSVSSEDRTNMGDKTSMIESGATPTTLPVSPQCYKRPSPPDRLFHV